MTQETISTSIVSDDEVNTFRKVLPAAYDSIGRSLPQILYDRSIKGPFAPGGRRREPTIETSNQTDPTYNAQVPQHKRLKMNEYPTHISNEIRNYGEQQSVTDFTWKYLGLKKDQRPDTTANPDQPRRLNNNDTTPATSAISTISVSFSPDGRTVASTHGDHTVKITCCHTGALIRSLEGHPRTPWTVKYHPTKSNIVASGCLGCQVLVWDWNYKKTSAISRYRNELEGKVDSLNTEDNDSSYFDGEGKCLNRIRLQSAIISLSFHPSGHILAVASGTTLHLWDYDDNESHSQDTSTNQRNGDDGNQHQGYGRSRGRGTLTEIQHEDNLRCVHFPPGGDTIIVGGVNPRLQPTRGLRVGGDTSYSLKVLDFDLEAALNPHLYLGQQGQVHTMESHVTRREAISNPRIFVPRALLYNDGGFDVSPDGKTLCGCAEYWLPPDVNSASELLHQVVDDDETEEENEEKGVSIQDSTNSISGNETTPSEQYGLNEGYQNVDDEKPILNRQDNSFRSPPRTNASGGEPMTPPNPVRPQIPTTPPSPPGRRWSNLAQRYGLRPSNGNSNRSSSNRFPQHSEYNSPPLPPYPQPHPLAIIGNNTSEVTDGRYVPHVVVVSLDESNLGTVLEATPLGSRASSVTCVKFSPSAEFCLLGYGVRENAPENAAGGPAETHYHPVTSIYRIRGGMTHITTMLSGDDDVNIARFHPESGHGFVYGTKQGRLRVLAPRPWNHYYT